MLKRIFPAMLVLSASAIGLLSGCTGGGSQVSSKRAGINEVIVHINADPQRLNPVTSNESSSSLIQNQMFSYLLDIDPVDFHLVPVLAVSRPKITQVETGEYAGGLTIEFELRPEAKWDNGTPVLGTDADFTFKAYKNPLVDCEAQRGYLQFIDDLKVDPSNPRKFTLYCKGHYMLSEIQASTLQVIPEYVYDAKKIMRGFTVKELNDSAKIDKLKSNDKIIEFAKDFNSEKFQREAGSISGSGPYAFESWTTTQRVIVKRKANWWGDALAKAGEKYFTAGPEKITYEIVPDPTTSATAFKDERLDVGNAWKTKDYVELMKNDEFKKRYNLYQPAQVAYIYIAMNEKKPQLADKKVRQALSYALDKSYVLSTFYYNLGELVVGPFSPAKDYYAKNLKPYAFDLAKAKTLLDEAGWKDSDGDGIRDKEINGQKVPLRITYTYPSPGPAAENTGLLLKENCAKIGIGIDIQGKEWTVFLQENKQHKFDMFFNAWNNDPIPDDPYQIWHSASYSNGDNYPGFGTAESDALIEKIRYEIDDNKRKEMYLKLQDIIYDECPYIFLLSPKNKIAIHKRFDNANATVKRPGYEVNQFKINPTFGAKATPAKMN